MFRDSGTCDGIEEYTTSVTGFINKCIEDVVPTVTVCIDPIQKPWITSNIHTELKGRPAISRSKTLTQKLIRNPSMPSNEPSNRQSVNTGLRSNSTTPVPTLVGCGRACKLLQTTKGSQPRAAQWHEPIRQAMLASRQVTLKHAWEHQLFRTTVWSRSTQPMWVRPLNRSTFTRPLGQMDYQDVYSELCENAIHWLQLSVQHHRALKAHH